MERAQKRRKATKACDNCRRQKSRCEWNSSCDESPDGGCHRCRVLSQTCTIDGQALSQNTPRGPSPGPSSRFLKDDETPTGAGSSVQEESLLRYQPSFHEWLHSLENSESFFTGLGKVAWGTPMAMVARLMAWNDRKPFSSSSGENFASTGILSAQEVQELLSVFEQKYEPWLGIEAPTPTSQFLISVRCLIAARHLPAHRRLVVIPPLHTLCREQAMNCILSSTPNLASIQALHILSTWEPIESFTSAGQRMEVQNGGALMAAAIAHASTLRLDAAAEFVHSHPNPKDVPEDVKFKAKIWLSLCASEFTHCVGEGRFRLSAFRQITASTLDEVDLSNPTSARRVRLNFLTHMITRLEEGFKALLKSTESTVLSPVLTPLESWLVRFSHLHLITNVEKPCFHALLIQHHGYRVLLFAHAVVQIFILPGTDAATRLNNLRETTWGRQLVLSAETVLVEFVRFGEQTYAPSLSHAPDHLFNLICLATLVLLKTRHMYGGVTQPYPLPTLTPLIERVTEFFKRLALAEDHLPAKCAMLVERLMKAYDRIRSGPAGVNSGEPGTAETPPTDDPIRQCVRLSPPPRPPVSTSAPHSTSATTTESGTRMTTEDYAEANASNPAQDLDLDGLMNIDQMGGIEMFFSQSVLPENVLSGLLGQSDGGGTVSFELRNLFGLYDAQTQF